MKAYFLERICAVTGMNLKIEDIPILFDSTLVTESTIRCVSNSMLDVSNQIIKSKIPNLEFRGKIVNLSQNVLRLLVVLRRLNLCIEDPENEKIKGDDFIVKIIKEQLRGNLNSNLWHYFLPYFLYFMNGSLESCIWFKSDKFNLCGLVISCINEDGSVEFEQLYQLSSDGYKKCDYDSVIRKMLNCIAK
ncbi:MAG TPA: hypothetical protein PLN63_07070 [Paludibacteraceae bacterium]|nr:hypothetical protein [Paludibacteraceae bacterium]HPH63363.1 hypothetical protein [Paludibacteraceae bacterium]